MIFYENKHVEIYRTWGKTHNGIRAKSVCINMHLKIEHLPHSPSSLSQSLDQYPLL